MADCNMPQGKLYSCTPCQAALHKYVRFLDGVFNSSANLTARTLSLLILESGSSQLPQAAPRTSKVSKVRDSCAGTSVATCPHRPGLHSARSWRPGHSRHSSCPEPGVPMVLTRRARPCPRHRWTGSCPDCFRPAHVAHTYTHYETFKASCTTALFAQFLQGPGVQGYTESLRCW